MTITTDMSAYRRALIARATFATALSIAGVHAGGALSATATVAAGAAGEPGSTSTGAATTATLQGALAVLQQRALPAVPGIAVIDLRSGASRGVVAARSFLRAKGIEQMTATVDEQGLAAMTQERRAIAARAPAPGQTARQRRRRQRCSSRSCGRASWPRPRRPPTCSS